MATIHTLDIAGQRDDELLSRLIDGECSSEERLELEERLANDAKLRDRLEQFRANDRLLRASVGNDDNTIPPAVLNALTSHSPAQTSRYSPRYGFALAASLVLATAVLLINNNWLQPVSQTPQIDLAFAEALDALPSRAEGWDTIEGDRALRMVITFPAADGKWCREFMLASQADHWRGVACRGAESWVTQVIGRDVFLEEVGGYRTASASDSDAIAQFIDQTATGIALSGDEEAALIATDWSLAAP